MCGHGAARHDAEAGRQSTFILAPVNFAVICAASTRQVAEARACSVYFSWTRACVSES